MKKLLATGFLVVTLFGLSLNVAQAASLTSDQISAIIGLVRSFGGDESTLRNVEDSLYGRIPTSSGSPATSEPVKFCYNWTRNLKIGDVGADVFQVYKFMAQDGFYTQAIN